MKTEFNFTDVIGRAKKALNIKDDKDFAERIGMKPTTFNSRKTAGSIPYDELLSLARTEKLDYNWLFTGEGVVFKSALAEPQAGYKVDLKVLYPELTENQVKKFEVEISEEIEFNKMKEFFYKNSAAA